VRIRILSKKRLFSLALVGIVFVGCELVTRIFFAFLVGPHVLTYGVTGDRGETLFLAGPAMRAFKLHSTPDPTVETAGYSKFAPYTKRTDKTEHGEKFTPTINRYGFRGDDWPVDKPPGTVRVVTLGASSTFGYHDRDDETYPHYLEQRLNAASPSGDRFEVLNLGVPHVSSEEIVPLFIHEALPLDPDVVTLYAGRNDCGRGSSDVMDRRKDPPAGTSFATAALGHASRRLLMAAFLESVLYYATVISPHNEEDVRILAEDNVPIFIGNVSQIRDLCEDRGILLVVATQQSRSKSHYRIGNDITEQTDIDEITYGQEASLLREKLARGEGIARRELTFLVHGEIMSELRDWAHANDVPLADALDALDHDRHTLLSWVHLNPEGNRIVADTFASVILSSLGSELGRDVAGD
jgi:lysophospholipase L1-like esterase